MQPHKQACLYVMAGPDGLTKLGLSRDPGRRVLKLKSSLVLQIPMRAHHVWSAEHKLHDHFKSARVRGEWFRLTYGQVESIPALLRTLAPIGFGPGRPRKHRNKKRAQAAASAAYRARQKEAASAAA